MTTFILTAIVVFLLVVGVRMILRHRAEQDERARLNYERHQYERQRKLLNAQQETPTQRAGHRRAGEYSWGREGEGA